MRHFFTSESVTEGHPDKVCDQSSDAVLDAILTQDPNAHVACETVATTGMIMVMGEVTTTADVVIDDIVRGCLRDIGYTDAAYGIDCHSCAVLSSIHEQSPDIAQGVNREIAEDQGAGDQGMMFGYACNETKELMPLAIALAHNLTRRLAELRKDGTLPWLRPDGKSQVTIEYEDDQAVRVDTIVVSTQHDDIPQETIREAVIEQVIKPVIPSRFLDDQTRYYVNPTGRFVIGGPQGDTGLTGRKIIVDTYGGYAHHGGGAFSGKDPSKVDRSAAYAMRHVAKNLVAAGLCDKCEVGVAYAIGVAQPVGVFVNTFGTGTRPDDELARLVNRVFDLRPAAIIRDLGLKAPIYRQTASYGHFGRFDLDLPWERLDKVEALKAEA